MGNFIQLNTRLYSLTLFSYSSSQNCFSHQFSLDYASGVVRCWQQFLCLPALLFHHSVCQNGLLVILCYEIQSFQISITLSPIAEWLKPQNKYPEQRLGKQLKIKFENVFKLLSCTRYKIVFIKGAIYRSPTVISNLYIVEVGIL